MEKMTLQDIADKIGVSRLTISKVLNNKPGVSDKMRRLVRDALITYNYKNLADYSSISSEGRQHSNATVGMIVRDYPHSSQWIPFLDNLLDELGRAGLQVDKIELGPDTKPGKLLAQLGGSQLNCLLVLHIYDEAFLQVIRQSGIPAVYLDGPQIDGRLPGDLLTQRDREPARYMTERLLEAGLTRFGFIGDIRQSGTIYERWLGFNDALAESNAVIDPEWTFNEAPGHFATLGEVSSLINACSSLPQVVFCAVDQIALHLLEALSYRKEQAASEVLIVTFGYLHHKKLAGHCAANAFISSSVLARRISRQAAKRVEDPYSPFELVAIEPQINVREHLLPITGD